MATNPTIDRIVSLLYRALSLPSGSLLRAEMLREAMDLTERLAND